MHTRDPGRTLIIRKGLETARGPGPDVMAASTLTGNTVLTTVGDDVGKISEIMLDVGSGRIAYAVLSSGGRLGIGDKLLAIPWSALTLDTERQCFLLPVSLEQLRSASGFDKDHWPATADPRWASWIHKHYGSTAHSGGDAPGLDSPDGDVPPDEPARGEGRH
ncbi:PRC-barrel domain-containing protein [Burkholderia sp. BCC1977]|uniref:PRC-barrel domain-containing protein n=1 Tax=Burkholderia sp. BCC1977 TaxID=2817440 RepID=UPI002ABDA968|nr:PRC-barrel domain-containing protein [Burkholderia sp. BCC1977]